MLRCHVKLNVVVQSRFTILDSTEETLAEYVKIEELVRAGSPGWYKLPCLDALQAQLL